MTKYNVQSAGVLNEADRFERILNWQLFCMEQESMLFGFNPDVEWAPGDFLLSEPVAEVDYFGEVSFTGNCPRDMFEIIGLTDHDNEDGSPYFDHDDTMDGSPVKCRDCMVSWGYEETTCWMCGKDYPRPPTSMGALMKMIYGTSTPRVVHVEPRVEDFLASSTLDRYSAQLMYYYSAMDARLTRELVSEQARTLNEAWDRRLWSRAALSSQPIMLRPIRGHRSNLVIMDEAPPPPDMITVEVFRGQVESLPDSELFPTVLNLEGSRPRDAPNPAWVVPITIPREMPDRNPIPLPEMEPVEIGVPEDLIHRSYPTSRYITQERRSRR